MCSGEAGESPAQQAFEARCGAVPEKPIVNWSFSYEAIGEAPFKQAWTDAREALNP